jgi:uncharacterized protein (TIRG00374 family)
VTRVVALVITAVSLYIVLPSLIQLFGDLPRLRSVFPLWFVPPLVFEALAFVCMWELMRVALRTHNWFDIATAQLTGNALSRALPGGAATGGATQYQMLTRAGFAGTTVTTSLTAVGLLSTTTLFTLPMLALPALLTGLAVDSRLLRGAIVGVVVALFLLSGASALLLSDRLVRLVGAAADWVVSRVRRTPIDPPYATRLLDARNFLRSALADSWKRAVPAAYGNQLFDYSALSVSLYAVGARVDPVPILLAYVFANVLAMIPLTPGGLGFVEAGLTGALALAGVPPDQAVLGTLVYRLFSYWLTLPAGAIASALYARRHRTRATA